jgi:hypothetical protein
MVEGNSVGDEVGITEGVVTDGSNEGATVGSDGTGIFDGVELVGLEDGILVGLTVGSEDIGVLEGPE